MGCNCKNTVTNFVGGDVSNSTTFLDCAEADGTHNNPLESGKIQCVAVQNVLRILDEYYISGTVKNSGTIIMEETIAGDVITNNNFYNYSYWNKYSYSTTNNYYFLNDEYGKPCFGSKTRCKAYATSPDRPLSTVTVLGGDLDIEGGISATTNVTAGTISIIGGGDGKIQIGSGVKEITIDSTGTKGKITIPGVVTIENGLMSAATIHAAVVSASTSVASPRVEGEDRVDVPPLATGSKPSSPTAGTLYFDTTETRLKYFDGSAFKSVTFDS